MPNDFENFIDANIHKASLWRRLRWSIHKWKMRTARRWLRAHDPDYVVGERVNDLIRRRTEAREAGIGPGDPRYPRLDMS